MRFRGDNPVYKYGNYDQSYSDVDSATYGGVVTKTSILLGIIAVTALYFANNLSIETLSISTLIPVFIAPIVAIIAVIMTHRMPQIAFATSILYGICEGVFLGFISAIYAFAFGGEIIQMALVGTFGVLAGMLFLYSTGLIRVGNFFRRLMFSALIGLIFVSLIFVVLSFTNLVSFAGFYNIYIGIVVISVIISSLFLLVDFDNITKYVEANAPKESEWSLALGLVVTIVWVYIELLRLYGGNMSIIRNPLYPESYNYQGEKTASYLGMFTKIFLLIIITVFSIFYGYTVIDTISLSNIFTYTLILPIIALVSLYAVLKVEQLKSVLSIVFSVSQGIAVGYYVHLVIVLSGNPFILIAVFTTVVILIVMVIINMIKPFREQNVLFKAVIAGFLGIAISLVGSIALDYMEIEYSYDTLFTTIPMFSFFGALFYTIDFDQLFRLVDVEAPKEKEWDLALGLILTIVWIYVRVVLLVIAIARNARRNKQNRK